MNCRHAASLTRSWTIPELPNEPQTLPKCGRHQFFGANMYDIISNLIKFLRKALGTSKDDNDGGGGGEFFPYEEPPISTSTNPPK